jgi:hypothetical protein
MLFILVHNVQHRQQHPHTLAQAGWLNTKKMQHRNKHMNIKRYLHMNLAKWHLKNKCYIVSGCAQKTLFITFPIWQCILCKPWSWCNRANEQRRASDSNRVAEREETIILQKTSAYSILFANRPSLLGEERHARGADRLRRRGAASPHASLPWSFARRLTSLRPPIGCARRLASLRAAGPLPSAGGRLLISLRPPAPTFLPQLETNIGSKAKDRTGGALRAGSRAPIKGGSLCSYDILLFC